MIERAVLTFLVAVVLLSAVPLIGAEVQATFHQVASGFTGTTLIVKDEHAHD